jgi:hypothetical protein
MAMVVLAVVEALGWTVRLMLVVVAVEQKMMVKRLVLVVLAGAVLAARKIQVELLAQPILVVVAVELVVRAWVEMAAQAL